jgi:tetratricopeptide (TPR) repeat protein
MNIGETLAAQGFYALGEARCRQALPILHKAGMRGSQGRALLALGLIHYHQGDYAQARAFLEESWRLCRDHGSRWVASKGLAVLGLVCHARGDDEAARDYAQRALENGPLEYHLGQGDSALVLGHALAGLGDRTGASDAYQQALDRYHQSGFLNPPMEALAGLARVALAGGEPSQARVHVDEILEHLKIHSLDGTYEPFRVYWTCYRVLEANDDPRAGEILRAAYHLLQDRAARIDDEHLRRSFLKEVPWHRELAQEGERAGLGGHQPQPTD